MQAKRNKNEIRSGKHSGQKGSNVDTVIIANSDEKRAFLTKPIQFMQNKVDKKELKVTIISPDNINKQNKTTRNMII